MSYKKCLNCGFWLDSQEKHCPNCGTHQQKMITEVVALSVITLIIYLILWLSISSLSSTVKSIQNFFVSGIYYIFGFAVMGFLTCVSCFLFEKNKQLIDKRLLYTYVISIAFVGTLNTQLFGFYDLYGFYESDPYLRFLRIPSNFLFYGFIAATSPAIGYEIYKFIASSHPSKSPSLKFREDRINQRRKEIDGKINRFTEMQSVAGSSNRREKRIQILQNAIKLLQSEQKRWEVKLWEIEQVRWINTLDPLIHDWKNVKHEEYKRRLENLQIAENEGEKILQRWKDNHDLAVINDGKKAIDRLQNALAVIPEMVESLVQNQIVFEMQDISPLQSPLFANISLDQFDLLDARLALGEFSDSFQALEAESERLQIEQQVMQELETDF